MTSMEGFGARALERLNPRIVRVSDESSHGIARMQVFFTNGWGMSIIRGPGSYGHEDELFEALAIDPSGVMLTDKIFGWLTEEEVMQAVEAISLFATDQPAEVDELLAVEA